MNADEKACPDCAETVKLAAKVCKHCGYRFETEVGAALDEPKAEQPVVSAEAHDGPPLEQKSWADNTFEGGAKTLTGCIGAVVVGIGLLGLSFCGSPEVEDRAKSSGGEVRSTGVDETEIVTLCDLTLKQGLAVEADLDFGWKFIPLSGGEYRVERGFKAQNAFGATLKHTYSCTYDTDRKRITQLNVEGPAGIQNIL